MSVAHRYYEGKLRTLLSYDDLKPEVFQNFREVGNSVALLKDLSNILDVQAQFDFNFLAPLLGITPSAATTNGVATPAEPLAPGTFASPVETVISHLHGEISASPALQQSVVKSLEVFNRLPGLIHRQVENITALHASNATTPAAAGGNKTLFKYVLLQIEEFMFRESLSTDWAAQHSAPGSNAAIEISNAKGFHRLFSALSFLFSMTESAEAASPVEGEEEDELTQVSNEAEFGHGFTLTGCLLLHLLGQRSTFELMDFSYYVLKVAHYDDKSQYTAQQAQIDVTSLLKDTKSFVSTAATQQKLQTELFAFFEAQYEVRESYKKNAVSKMIYHPPVEEDFL
jgi:cytoplasmic FMR1 interacting protein